MSGDVQPRKRNKDKKKRKDEGDFITDSEDQNIHVHKDGGTGGNICAKIVFFFLFSALIVLIGLIIKENQGLNELESIEAESRFSQIFEGWIDKSVDDHSPEDVHSEEDLNDHDEHSPEEDDDHSVEEEEEESVQSEDEEEEESPLSDEEYDEESQPSEEETTELSEEKPDSRETDEVEEEVNSIQADDDDEDSNPVDDEDSKQADDADSKQIDDAEDEPDVESDKQGEAKNEEGPEGTEAEPAKESSGLATKIGVGLALIIVAHNVFIRKRKTDIAGVTTDLKPPVRDDVKEPTPDLSRRNTIIPPPTLQEIEADLPEIEVEDEEYSEEEEEEYSDEEEHSEHRNAREEYQQLRTTYTRSMSPEGDFQAKNVQYEEEVLESDDEAEEEEEDDDEKYDLEDDDDELLKRLEAKYGKLGREIEMNDEESGALDKDEEFAIKEDIDAAQAHLPKNAALANKLFEALLDRHPYSLRTIHGKAQALDQLADEKQSNELLDEALSYYLRALSVPKVPDGLFVQIAERYINRARFMGQYKKAIGVHWQLIERFPENVTHLNSLAITYLTINLVEEARTVLKRILSKSPDDGVALVHYGFILKTVDNDLENAVKYIGKGLKTNAPGVVDGRFYFHLGDALTRLNRKLEAEQEGVKHKLFLSKYQRSLYNLNRLTAKPWWEISEISVYEKLFSALKNNWQKIKFEGLAALNEHGHFQDEAENLKDSGTWKQLELFARGHKSKYCEKVPFTCGIVNQFPEARGCRRGQTKFSVMHPGTHVWPHCGPSNCRLRVHLGLKVPPGTFIRVAEETRSWKEGDLIIFDDSFEHEVWHNGSDFRLVLIVDVWHPEVTVAERKSLSPI